MKKFTTIATKKGHFNVFKDNGGEKYFLEYLKNDEQPEKVGYLVKESGDGYKGDYYLQEAFFDKCNWPHTSLRSTLSEYDDYMNKDLWDNLSSACYLVEKEFWCKDFKRKRIDKSQRWAELINKLQKGTDLETAVRSLAKA